MEPNITWLKFFSIISIFVLVYIFLVFALRFLPQVFKRKTTINKTKFIVNKIIEIYKPIAILVILLSFVSINYKVHGFIFLLFLLITFSHIKRYLHGVLFKINPLVSIGTNITTGEFKGDISKFMFFGFVINLEDGDRFINYQYIDQNGFSINQNENASVRRTIYIESEKTATHILDILFENPSIDFNNKPVIKKVPNETKLQLQVALESGAKMDSLIAYLNQNNITTSLSKN